MVRCSVCSYVPYIAVSALIDLYSVLAVILSTTLASRLPNARAYVGFGGYCVAILGAILVNTLSSHLKVGLLCSYWLGGASATARFNYTDYEGLNDHVFDSWRFICSFRNRSLLGRVNNRRTYQAYVSR